MKNPPKKLKIEKNNRPILSSHFYYDVLHWETHKQNHTKDFNCSIQNKSF